eukprot:scaffold5700_cov125-Skeletonema_marinoi.AAC.2
MDAEKIELVGDNSYGSFVQEESSIDNINNKIYIYWIFLAGAIIFEVMGTTMMKLSEGLTQILPSIAIFLFYGCSFILMPLSLKRIELSTAYAIWSGVGTTLTSLIGVWLDVLCCKWQIQYDVPSSCSELNIIEYKQR